MGYLDNILQQKKELHAECVRCITSILQGGAAYKIGDREFTRADLDTVRRMEKEALSDVLKLENGNVIRTSNIVTTRGDC